MKGILNLVRNEEISNYLRTKRDMKKILVTAGGTATAWHICSVAQKYYKDEISIIVTDINDPDSVPSVVLAEKVIQVPYSDDLNYVDVIDNVIKEEQIDCIIPLIPQEAFLFHPESNVIISNNIFTTIPPIKTVEILADKKKLYSFLLEEKIPTPRIYEVEDVDDEKTYIVKPRLGFGSIGVDVLKGSELRNGCKDFDSFVIQEYCRSDDYDEVTVEVFNSIDRIQMFARRREEVKSGVCTKMQPVSIEPFKKYVDDIVKSIECPIALNVQFLRDRDEWKLFDFNLRLPAGTALSTAIGFQLTRALLAEIIGKPVKDEYFKVDKSVKHVLRTYQEIAVR